MVQAQGPRATRSPGLLSPRVCRRRPALGCGPRGGLLTWLTLFPKSSQVRLSVSSRGVQMPPTRRCRVSRSLPPPSRRRREVSRQPHPTRSPGGGCVTLAGALRAGGALGAVGAGGAPWGFALYPRAAARPRPLRSRSGFRSWAGAPPAPPLPHPGPRALSVRAETPG